MWFYNPSEEEDGQRCHLHHQSPMRKLKSFLLIGEMQWQLLANECRNSFSCQTYEEDAITSCK